MAAGFLALHPFGKIQPKIMNVIDSKNLELDCADKLAQSA
jgi:hypothetical protein